MRADISYPVSIDEIECARGVVRKFVPPACVIHSPGLSSLIGAQVYVVYEHHNPTGSFKIRGGANLLHHLAADGVANVITFSTGNHGLSIATAASWHNINATIVVPEHNNPHKNRAILSTGAELVERGRVFEESERVVDELERQRSAYVVHPANEPHLLNGVGTEFLDVLDVVPDVDVMMVPLGAGSEAAAAITTFTAKSPQTQIIAVQAQASPAAYDSWRSGRHVERENRSFAGGFATGKVYELPYSIYREGLADFVLLTEDDIYDGIAMAMHHLHTLTEGAGSATLAAAYRIRERLRGRTVVLQISGCNASDEEIRIAANRQALMTGTPGG